MYKNGQNPSAILEQNPNIKQAIDFIRQSGGSPQQAFYSLAQRMGVNPDLVLKQLGI